MSRYDALVRYVDGGPDATIEMTLAGTGRLAGALAASAATYREWWSTERAEARHVQAGAWLVAGAPVRPPGPTRKELWFSARIPRSRS